jgi:hypothetical protein
MRRIATEALKHRNLISFIHNFFCQHLSGFHFRLFAQNERRKKMIKEVFFCQNDEHDEVFQFQIYPSFLVVKIFVYKYKSFRDSTIYLFTIRQS